MTPLVCLHGIGTSGAIFERQIAGISGRDVSAWNMPGFGGEPLVGQYSFADLSDRLEGLLDKRGVASVDLLGHSMGGMVALDFAATRPDRVRSLVLVNTTPAFGGRDDSFKKQFVSARLAPLDAGRSMAEIAPAAAKAVLGPEASEEDAAFVAGLMAETPEAAFRAAIHCLVTFDRRAALPDIQQACLVIAAENDQAAPARTMEKMAGTLHHAHYHLLPGGHMSPVEQSARLNELTRDFLNGVDGDTA